MVRVFQKNHFLIGLSVDGTKEIHDSYRHTKDGKPTFDRIRHAAELMSHYGVEYNILTVVNQKVASNITEIYEFYKNKDGITSSILHVWIRSKRHMARMSMH